MFRPGDIITHKDKYVKAVYGNRFRVTAFDGIRLFVQPEKPPSNRDLVFARLMMCEVITSSVADTFDEDGVE